MSNIGAKRKADLKVIILGESDVGKTCFIQRHVEGTFKDSTTTIGASFSLTHWGPFNIAIWDTAGSEKFAGLSGFYCRSAGAAILAFDLTNADSFNILRTRFVPLLEAADEDCLSIVVGMKSDKLAAEPREVSAEQGMALARELNSDIARTSGGVPYFETSSLTGSNVSEVFHFIFSNKLPSDPTRAEDYRRSHRPEGVVDLEQSSNQGKSNHSHKRCC